MKKVIALFTVVILIMTQSLTLIASASENSLISTQVNASSSNAFYGYWNELTTLERRNTIETQVECFKQYTPGSSYEIFVNDLIRGLNDSGLLTEAGIQSTTITNLMNYLATEVGQDWYRDTLEPIVIGTLDDTTLGVLLSSLRSKISIMAVSTSSLESVVIMFLNAFSVAQIPIFYMDSGVIKTVTDFELINSSIKIAFDNQINTTALNLPSIAGKFAVFLNGQTSLIKDALTNELEELGVFADTEPVVKDDFYTKYNKLTIEQKTELSASLLAYVQSDELYDAINLYYNNSILSNSENAINSFGFSSTDLKTFIEKLRNTTNKVNVDALFSAFSSMSEVSIMARIDAGVTSGLIDLRLQAILKKLFPLLNSYSKIDKPIFDETNGGLAVINDNVDKLQSFFNLLFNSGSSGTTFRSLAEKALIIYNGLPLNNDKKNLRDYLVYFSFMNKEVTAPTAVITPANNSVNASLSSIVKIKFSEPVSPGEDVNTLVECFRFKAGTKNISFTVKTNEDFTEYSLIPSRLYADQTYKVETVSGKLFDFAGNVATCSSTFKTPKLIYYITQTCNMRNKVSYLSPGGSNAITFTGKAVDGATYKLVYKVGSSWKVAYTTKIKAAGIFNISWNGKVDGKYLKASSKPYQFKLICEYNFTTIELKAFKVIIQDAPKSTITCKTFYNPSSKKKLLVLVKWDKFTDVKVGVYDNKGKLVKLLFNEKNLKASKGTKIYWNGKDAKGKNVKYGIYYIKIITGDKRVSKKIIVTNNDYSNK